MNYALVLSEGVNFTYTLDEEPYMIGYLTGEVHADNWPPLMSKSPKIEHRSYCTTQVD